MSLNPTSHSGRNAFDNRTDFAMVKELGGYCAHNSTITCKQLGMKKPAETSLDGSRRPIEKMTVAVIIPTFNYAHFLADAIKSVLAQTRRADEIIVVDDGSTDDPAAVVAQFQAVRIIRQKNRGLSAARNTGLWNSKASHVVFLDADDRLLPHALEAGLKCVASHPGCALVYGGCNFIAENGDSWSRTAKPIIEHASVAFLRYPIDGIMTVVFQRDCLLAINGFDETLRTFEDRDIYLRLAQRYPVASHSTIVAEYRKHGQAMSTDYVEMLKGGLLVLDLNEARISTDPAARSAAREGRRNLQNYYVSQMLNAAAAHWRAHHDIGILLRNLIRAARWLPLFTLRWVLRALARRAIRGHLRSVSTQEIKRDA